MNPLNLYEKQRIRDKIKKRASYLPDFVVDYLYLLEHSKELKTVYEYAKDWHLFFEYIQEHHLPSPKSSKDITVEDLGTLTDRTMVRFFHDLTLYQKTFLSTKGKEITQTYTNNAYGKSRKLASLNVLFQYLISKDLISANPMKYIDIKLPTKTAIGKRLDEDELSKLFSNITNGSELTSKEHIYHDKLHLRDYTICMVLAFTGIRIEELRNLSLTDVHMKEEYFIVTRKGGNEQAIYMPEILVEQMNVYLPYRNTLKATRTEDKDVLFLSLQHKRMDQKTIRNRIKKYAAISDITKNVTPHTFRRTFGTKHYNEYGDMYLTAQVLGHFSAETTRKNYADPNESRVIQSMKSFGYQKKNR